MQAIAQEYNRQGSKLACDFLHASKSRGGSGGLILVGFGKVDERSMKGDWRNNEKIHARALRGGWCCCRCRFYLQLLRVREPGLSLQTEHKHIVGKIGKRLFRGKRLSCSRRVCLEEN